MKKMRFIPAALLVLTITIITSCSTASKITGPNGTPSNFKGNWTVNDVDIEGAAKSSVKVSVFDDGLYSCFIGSQWNLVQNGNGTYSIQATDQGCTAGVRTIYWSLQTANDAQYFLFKKLSGGEKPKNVTDGYRLKVTSLSDNAMVLQSTVDFEGKTIYINYHFSK